MCTITIIAIMCRLHYLGRGRFDGVGQGRASGEQRQRRGSGQQPAVHCSVVEFVM